MWQLIGGLIGLVGNAAGSYTQAEQAKSAYKFNADVADFNAELEELKAQDAIERGGEQEQRVKRGERQLKGQQIAAAAGSGVSIGSGSLMALFTGTEVMAAADIDTIRDNTAAEVFQHETAALQARTQADVARTTGGTIDPYTTSMTSVAGSSGQVAGMWDQFSSLGK